MVVLQLIECGARACLLLFYISYQQKWDKVVKCGNIFNIFEL